MSSDDLDTGIFRIRELQQHYRAKQQEAVIDGDDIGAAYFSGYISGLIWAEEAIKND